MAIHTDNAIFDRFDIAEAWYMYALRHHSGQWSKEYAILGRLHRVKFKASPLLSKPAQLSGNGRIIYCALMRAKGRAINHR